MTVEQNNKQKFLEEIEPGDEFSGFLAIRRKDIKEWDGKFRLELELGDRSMSLPAVIWDDVEKWENDLEVGDVLKVQGVLTTYRGSVQFKLKEFEKTDGSVWNPELFIPVTEKDRRQLIRDIREVIDSLTDEYLCELLNLFFRDTEFLARFGTAPGGKAWHHVYIGGLLEHTVGVLRLCKAAAEGRKDINHDLLYTAAILHDVGKIDEYEITTNIDFSDEGRLIGHLIQGDRMIRDMTGKIKGFPERINMLLSHLILSHQGHKEYGSPVVPMIAEGIILYYADEMDSKLNAFKRIKGKKSNIGSTWSEYVKLMERFFYLDNKDDSEH